MIPYCIYCCCPFICGSLSIAVFFKSVVSLSIYVVLIFSVVHTDVASIAISILCCYPLFCGAHLCCCPLLFGSPIDVFVFCSVIPYICCCPLLCSSLLRLLYSIPWFPTFVVVLCSVIPYRYVDVVVLCSVVLYLCFCPLFCDLKLHTVCLVLCSVVPTYFDVP